jgi:hypothetical protein
LALKCRSAEPATPTPRRRTVPLGVVSITARSAKAQ